MKYLYFSAPWCGPCKVLAPKMEILAESVTVEKILVDDNQEMTAKFGVRSIPTVILIDENENEIERFVGTNTVEFYLEKFNEYVN